MSPRVRVLALCGALLGVVLGGVVLGGGACGGRAPAARPADGGVVEWVPRPPLGDADALRALAVGHDEVWRRLGAHRLTVKSKLRVTAGAGQPDVLDEEHLLEAGPGGAWRALSTNSHDQGRELVFVGGDLYLRPRYGTFARRRPAEGEADRQRAETLGALRAPVELLARFVKVRDDGRATVAGRAALRLALGLQPRPRPAPPETEPRRQWRATVAVQRLAGTLAVDVQTGAPLALTLAAEFTFRQGERSATAVLELEGALAPGVQVAVSAPAHVPQPTRTRYHVERQQLLEGLVPPGAVHQ